MKFRFEICRQATWSLATKVMIATGVALGVLSCSPESPKAYRPAVFEKVTDQKIVVDPRVDILFVVDNSGSMYGHQANLAKNVAKFTEEFSKSSFIQYNIGVITTDNFRYAEPDCCGQLLGEPKIVTRKTPNLNDVLGRTFRVGTDGSASEMVFDPVVQALTEPNLSDWNLDFYRPAATLALMFITDAEDQSQNYNEKTFYDFLLNLKGGDPSKVLGYGVIVPSNSTVRCARDEEGALPKRIENFLGKLPNNSNNIMSLCDPDYGSRLAKLAKNIVREISTIRLSRVPYVPSIKVQWGALELPPDAITGWAFDSTRNAIILGEGIDWTSQPSGTPLTVTFDVGKY